MVNWQNDILTRRNFLTTAGQGLIAAGVADQIKAQTVSPQTPTPSIQLPPFKAETEKQSDPLRLPQPPSERIGFAVVGLGNLAVDQILPALAQSKKARLAALVSGSPDKARKLAASYGLPESSVYSYQTYDRLRDNPDVQVIYIVLPNGMHVEYVVRGAQAGKHILCEKPMATSVKECEEMIAACRQADRKLMVAYRIQYEPHHRLVRDWVRSNRFGQVKLIESVNAQRQGEPKQWRHDKKLAGGGALPDIGLYCLNTTRFLIGEEPTEISAQIYTTPGDPRFREVEENVLFQMRFPSGILSTNTTGYDAHESRRYRVHAPTGWIEMNPAFSYEGVRLKVAHAEGRTERTEEVVLTQKNQFALEIDHMADCVTRNQQPFSPGEEGLQDHRLMQAIYEAAGTGRPVKLAMTTKVDGFRGVEPEA